MRRRDAGDETILASEVPAVHADIAHAGFVVLCDKWRRRANAAAEPRLLHRRRQARHAELSQRLPSVKDILNRRAVYPARLKGLCERVAPLFEDFRWLLAT